MRLQDAASYIKTYWGRPYEHNSMAIQERANQDIVAMGRRMLTESHLGDDMAADACVYAAFIRNRVPRVRFS